MTGAGHPASSQRTTDQANSFMRTTVIQGVPTAGVMEDRHAAGANNDEPAALVRPIPGVTDHGPYLSDTGFEFSGHGYAAV